MGDQDYGTDRGTAEDRFSHQPLKRWKGDEKRDEIKEAQSTDDGEAEIEHVQEAETLTIDDLLDELLQKIFSYLPAQDVWTKSKVCKRWEQIARDPITLNQTQLFLDEKADDELYYEVLKGAPCIGEVYILPSHPPDALTHLICGPRVRKIVIVGDSDWHRSWPSPADLLALLAHNKLSLQQLSMPVDSRLLQYHKSHGGLSFQSLIAGMRRLNYLTLAGESWQDFDEWDLTREYPPLCSLKILDTQNIPQFDCRTCLFIRDLIVMCKPTLKTLHLPCQSPDDAISLLNGGVFQGSLIEELMVTTGCLRVISHMPLLKILAVSDNDVVDGDFSWFSTFPVLSRVWKLTLQSIVERENETQGFVWYLLSKFNGVTQFWGLDSSVEENTFNMFLRNNPSLKEIYFLDFVGFNNPSQVSLLENFLPNLIRIDLALSHISEEMRAALRTFGERRPYLKIVYDDAYDEKEVNLDPE